MWHKILRKLFRGTASRKPSGSNKIPGIPEGISPHLPQNQQQIKAAFGNSVDLVTREVQLGSNPHVKILLIYLEGLVNQQLLSDEVVKPLTLMSNQAPGNGTVFEAVKHRYLTSGGVTEVNSLKELLVHICNGHCGVLIAGETRALACSIRAEITRNVEEPISETVVRGPREGFTENIHINMALLRLRLKDPQLTMEATYLGTRSRTMVVLAYLQGLATPQLVAEAQSRLRRINIDGILESGYLEEYIEDSPASPFPQLLRTERPDRVAASLLEGRIAILTEGTPFVLLAPINISMLLTTPEDYYERYLIGSFLGLVRLGAVLVSLLLPSLYIAITTFHQELLPTPLIFSIAAQREGIPFPALAEALLLEGSFEVLREAGIRLPKNIGPAVTIVGVLIIGQTAVQAGLVSSFMLIIVAFTAIASFATVVYSLAITIRLLRFGFMFLAGSLGMFGIITGIFLLSMHLAALRSFGNPFMEPVMPLVTSDLKDFGIRVPWWLMVTRPRLIGRENPVRQPAGQKPRPPQEPEQQP